MAFHSGQEDLTCSRRQIASSIVQSMRKSVIVTKVELSEKTRNTSPDLHEHVHSDTQSDTSSTLSNQEEPTQPLQDLLRLDEFKTFVIDQQAGLTGGEVVAQYPCVKTENKFFIWIAATPIAYFSKNTFLNLADLAEKEGAQELYFLLSRDNLHVKKYKRMFEVIDAERVDLPQIQLLIKDNLVSRTVSKETLFFRLSL